MEPQGRGGSLEVVSQLSLLLLFALPASLSLSQMNKQNLKKKRIVLRKQMEKTRPQFGYCDTELTLLVLMTFFQINKQL